MTSIKEIEEEGMVKHIVKVKEGVKLVGTYHDNAQAKQGVILFPGITEHRSSLDALSLRNYLSILKFGILI